MAELKNECAKTAEAIAAAARAMGLDVRTAKSANSASHYVTIADPGSKSGVMKIRCSDHADQHGSSDLDVFPGGDLQEVAGHIAWRFKKQRPLHRSGL